MKSEEDLTRAFQHSLLKEINKKRNVIEKMVKKSLGSFSEYPDAKETAEKCITDILRRVKEQFEEPGEYSNRHKFKALKLKKFKENESYISEYLISAIKTYCRSKRKKCNAGRNAGDLQKGEKHKEVKLGKAVRVDNEGLDEIFDKSSTVKNSLSHVSYEAITATIAYLKRLHLNDKEIQCFWDKLEGMTYQQMADDHQESTSTKGNSENLYNKRFNRLKKKIKGKENKINDILMQDFHAINKPLGESR